MDRRLENKRALVTDGSRGIGAAIVKRLARDLDRTLAVNVRAVFVSTQAAVKHMRAGGRIINIGSCNAERMPFAGGGVYAMSKAALVGPGGEMGSYPARARRTISCACSTMAARWDAPLKLSA